jgi:hypothetical protein
MMMIGNETPSDSMIMATGGVYDIARAESIRIRDA